MIHPSSDVQAVQIGANTAIWQFCVVLKGAVIGNDCNINASVFIEGDVVIGDRVTVKSGVQLWNGLRVEDDVFIGPNATFTNDATPRSKRYPAKFAQTLLKTGCSIGANATILPGLTIGEYAFIAAGAVVTKSVPARALVVGNPAKIRYWVNEDGTSMKREGLFWVDINGIRWSDIDGVLTKLE